MNALSVAHAIVQNQEQKPSWIDDPFELGTVTGVTQLNHNRNLNDYAEELVATYAKYDGDQYDLSLDMLPDHEQNELVRLYIESIDREIEWACYGDDESLNSSFLCAMLAMLKDDNEETRQHFAETTRKNLLIYYKDSLTDLLDTACDTYHHATMNEQGLYAQYDNDNGDIVWRR